MSLRTCTSSNCVCPHFPATGICYNFSEQREVTLLARALLEQSKGDSTLWDLLTSRYKQENYTRALENALGRVRADYEIMKRRLAAERALATVDGAAVDRQDPRAEALRAEVAEALAIRTSEELHAERVKAE